MKAGEVQFVLGTLQAGLPPGKRADETQTAAYALALAALPYPPCIAAANRLGKSVEWMPTLGQFIDQVQIETQRLEAESLRGRGLPMAPGDAPYRCGVCLDGLGWVTVEDSNPPTVRPCHACRTTSYERWVDGHWRSDHEAQRCAVCREDLGMKAPRS